MSRINSFGTQSVPPQPLSGTPIALGTVNVSPKPSPAAQASASPRPSEQISGPIPKAKENPERTPARRPPADLISGVGKRSTSGAPIILMASVGRTQPIGAEGNLPVTTLASGAAPTSRLHPKAAEQIYVNGDPAEGLTPLGQAIRSAFGNEEEFNTFILKLKELSNMNQSVILGFLDPGFKNASILTNSLKSDGISVSSTGVSQIINSTNDGIKNFENLIGISLKDLKAVVTENVSGRPSATNQALYNGGEPANGLSTLGKAIRAAFGSDERFNLFISELKKLPYNYQSIIIGYLDPNYKNAADLENKINSYNINGVANSSSTILEVISEKRVTIQDFVKLIGISLIDLKAVVTENVSGRPSAINQALYNGGDPDNGLSVLGKAIRAAFGSDERFNLFISGLKELSDMNQSVIFGFLDPGFKNIPSLVNSLTSDGISISSSGVSLIINSKFEGIKNFEKLIGISLKDLKAVVTENVSGHSSATNQALYNGGDPDNGLSVLGKAIKSAFVNEEKFNTFILKLKELSDMNQSVIFGYLEPGFKNASSLVNYLRDKGISSSAPSVSRIISPTTGAVKNFEELIGISLKDLKAAVNAHLSGNGHREVPKLGELLNHNQKREATLPPEADRPALDPQSLEQQHYERRAAQLQAYLSQMQALAGGQLTASQRAELEARYVGQSHYGAANQLYQETLDSKRKTPTAAAVQTVLYGSTAQLSAAEQAYAQRVVDAIAYGKKVQESEHLSRRPMFYQAMTAAQLERRMQGASLTEPYFGMVAHDPGLGKTYTTLMALQTAGAQRVLLVGPGAAVKNTFGQEIAEALPGTVVLNGAKAVDAYWKKLEAAHRGQQVQIPDNLVVTGGAEAINAQTAHELRVRQLNEQRGGGDVVAKNRQVFYVLTNTEFNLKGSNPQTQARYEAFTGQLGQLGLDALAVDESHSLRAGNNADTIERFVTAEYASLARIRLGLTGTPVVGHEKDLTDQLSILSTVRVGDTLKLLFNAQGAELSPEEVHQATARHVERLTTAEVGRGAPPAPMLVDTPLTPEQWAATQEVIHQGTGAPMDKVAQLRALELQAKLQVTADVVADAMLNGKKVLIFTMMVEDGANAGRDGVAALLKRNPRLIERYGAQGVGAAVDQALGLHTGATRPADKAAVLQRFKQIGTVNGQPEVTALFATYGTFSVSTTAFDSKHLAKGYAVVALGLPWSQAELTQALARFHRTGNSVGTQFIVPMTSAPLVAAPDGTQTPAGHTVTESIYFAYIVPKQGAAHAALGDAGEAPAAGNASKLITLLGKQENEVRQDLRVQQRLSAQQLQEALSQPQAASSAAEVARANALGLRAEISAEVRKDLQSAPGPKVVVNLGGRSGAPMTPEQLQLPNLNVITVDDRAPNATQGGVAGQIQADIGQEMKPVQARIAQLLGQGKLAHAVVWNQSAIWGPGTERSTLAERLKQGAALLPEGGVAYLGDMAAALDTIDGAEFLAAAAQAGLQVVDRTILTRTDGGAPAVVIKFRKVPLPAVEAVEPERAGQTALAGGSVSTGAAPAEGGSTQPQPPKAPKTDTAPPASGRRHCSARSGSATDDRRYATRRYRPHTRARNRTPWRADSSTISEVGIAAP